MRFFQPTRARRAAAASPRPGRVALALLLAGLCAAAGPAPAWDRGTVAYGGSSQLELLPLMPPDSTFLLPAAPDGPVLRLLVRNRGDQPLDSLSLYLGISDFEGRGVQDFFRRVTVPAEGEAELAFPVGALADRPGFYDVRALAFASGRELGGHEYTFGYDVGRLPVSLDRPADFDRFWQATRDTLAALPLEATLLADTLQSDGMVAVWRVSYLSLHGVRVHGWLTVPRWKPGPHAALLQLPGYSSGRIAPNTHYARLGYAVLGIQVRGYGVDQAQYPADNAQYMTLGIEAPETYIYREIIAHCLRGIDFLASRPEVDPGRIGVTGGSQGGGLSLLTAGLDPRVRVVAANVPFLTDFPRSLTMSGNPYREIVHYLEEHPDQRERVRRTLGYFDALNLAERITVPTVVSAGLFDRTCPAPSIYGLYLRLGAKEKRCEVYPYLDHGEVGRPFSPLMRDWIIRQLPPVAGDRRMTHP